jgi:DNA-binding MarR family transcriptional regulator
MRTSDSTGDRLMTVARALRRGYGAVLSQWEVTPAQARALRVVLDHEPARLSALADRLHIAPRSATEVVDALERRGLVERGPDPDDRRATTVVVTPEGRRLQSVLEEARRAESERFLGTLTPADRAELDRILGLLVDALA